MGRGGVKFVEDGRKWRLPGLLYADDFFLCGESEEDLRGMVGRFAELCRKRGLKFNAGKSKVMVLNREEGLECEVNIDDIRMILSMSQNLNICGVLYFGRIRYGWSRM